MGAHHRRAYVCNLGYVNTKVDCDVRRHTRDSRHKSDTPRQHKTHTSKGKSKATARRERIRLKPSKGPSGCLGSAGEGRMHAKPGTRLSSDGAATPSPPTSTHTHTSTYTALQNASNDASSLTRRRCRTRRSRTGCTCRRNAGESRLPRSSPMLCACRQHAESQHWSHRSHPGGAGAIACASCVIGRAQNARGRAHERRWGEVWRVGMGWTAHRKTLIFECPMSFNEITNPSQLQRLASPCLSWSEKVLVELGGTP
jgi:hypothetical protein